MGTLLLRLAGPMQAWGDESKYDIRGTKKEPTKSGVIGMIAAALGLPRDSKKIVSLAEKIRMGVRVDQPGTVIQDFHTARAPKYKKNGFLDYDEAGNIIMEKSPYVTQRFYLSDAVFLVGLECDDEELLKRIEYAIKNPLFPLFLGRRSCPPTLPVLLGTESGELESALHDSPWIASDWYKEKKSCIRARIITETKKGQTAWYAQMDQPISYSPVYRRYSLRGLNKESYIMLGTPEHDPMSVL